MYMVCNRVFTIRMISERQKGRKQKKEIEKERKNPNI